ncbi:Transmembrane protein [Toxocara canis]|uniref:Transmembrane protein n=1 Tax=Toxocara canis TaxID=6265 RepID=A0A0B2VHA7_TOXCA|nr:Transmembrane protein [Toxocara canis]
MIYLRRRERFVLYGVCGFAIEVLFTAIWEAIENGNRKMHGLTSAYAFLIYGLSAVVQESLYLSLKVWSTWYGLYHGNSQPDCFQFDACPWDYAAYFRGHFMGVITAEYIPMWYLASMLCERFVIQNALHLGWVHPVYEKRTK